VWGTSPTMIPAVLLGELAHARPASTSSSVISANRTTPLDRALRSVAGALNGSRANLSVALQHECSPVFTVSNEPELCIPGTNCKRIVNEVLTRS
jgi:hypothetical protein